MENEELYPGSADDLIIVARQIDLIGLGDEAAISNLLSLLQRMAFHAGRGAAFKEVGSRIAELGADVRKNL